jgi:hypothetical protein
MMVRPLRLSVLLVIAAGVGTLHAQESAPAKPDATTDDPKSSPLAAPAADSAVTPAAANTTPAPPPKPHAAHVISPALAATLAVGRPKYSPPPPPIEQKPEDELPDLRDVDKPRNQIIRLPKMVVQDSRPPIFTEKKLYTDKGFAELLAKRYYSQGYLAFSRFASHSPLAFFLPSAEQSAMARYQEEERLQNMSDLNDAANLAAKAGDKADSEYIKAQSTDTYMRRMDWGYTPKK